MRYYLGADLGATKTHTLIVDETGRANGFGESGPANHESVGYEGMFQSMQDGLEQALRTAGLKKEEITGAGFGVAGYDWPSEMEATALVIDRLGLNAPYKFVNDSVPGLIAGSEEGWGVVVVSGTGSNCRGWDREHKREGRVNGAANVVMRGVHWTVEEQRAGRRGFATQDGCEPEGDPARDKGNHSCHQDTNCGLVLKLL